MFSFNCNILSFKFFYQVAVWWLLIKISLVWSNRSMHINREVYEVYILQCCIWFKYQLNNLGITVANQSICYICSVLSTIRIYHTLYNSLYYSQLYLQYFYPRVFEVGCKSLLPDVAYCLSLFTISCLNFTDFFSLFDIRICKIPNHRNLEIHKHENGANFQNNVSLTSYNSPKLFVTNHPFLA